MVGLHRPAAVGVLVAAEGSQQGRAERDEEDHEQCACCPNKNGSEIDSTE